MTIWSTLTRSSGPASAKEIAPATRLPRLAPRSAAPSWAGGE
jgi:hypothetical protein